MRLSSQTRIGIGVLVIVLCGWLIFRRPAPVRDEPAPRAAAARTTASEPPVAVRTDEPVRIEEPVSAVMRGGEALENAKAFALENNVRLTSHHQGGMRVNEAAVALLELTPSQAHDLQASLGSFLMRLRAAELAHAYVRKGAKSDEEIVVASFDRGEIIETLRSDLTTRLGPAVAEFIKARLPYDAILSAGNGEMRAYLQQEGGREWDVFSRTLAVKPRQAEMPGRVPGTTQLLTMPPVEHLTSRVQRQEQFNFRTRHLWAAIDRLPRR